jgi:hypothetical protein
MKLAKIATNFLAVLAIGLCLAPGTSAQQKPAKPTAAQASESPKAKAFASPEDAAAALYAAARRNDETELLVILGPDGKEIVAWTEDPQERQAAREEFARKYDQMHRLVKEPDETVALYVGAENWPLPIPLVKYNGAWYFDAELGRQEILYRRIGRNETEALEVCHALVDAEKEYQATAHHYTDKFVSAEGTHDGLYWKSTEEFGRSPIGAFLAHAGVVAGYTSGTPFHGYYYRVLLPGAAGAPASSEFAVLAFPAEYRSSGVTTFLVNQNGEAFEKDMGQSTASLAAAGVPYPPDTTWKKIE